MRSTTFKRDFIKAEKLTKICTAHIYGKYRSERLIRNHKNFAGDYVQNVLFLFFFTSCFFAGHGKLVPISNSRCARGEHPEQIPSP